MPWDSASFELLREEIRSSLRGRRPTGGVPFFLFLYDPSEEVRCLRNFEKAAKALSGGGFNARVIYLGKLFAHALQGTLYLTEAGIQAETRDPGALLRELSRPEGLPSRVTAALLDGVEGVSLPLRGGTQENCAILLRAGALYPFVHVSQVLDGLENKTNWTVVLPFPGSRHPERPEGLRFLNETEGPYYRARIIG